MSLKNNPENAWEAGNLSHLLFQLRVVVYQVTAFGEENLISPCIKIKLKAQSR